MPDGILPTETTAPELAAETADSRMVQHVRRNLVLWSAGTTLVILLILAAALYVAHSWEGYFARDPRSTIPIPSRLAVPTPCGRPPWKT